MAFVAREVNLNEAIRNCLLKIANGMKYKARHVERALIILYAADGLSNAAISKKLMGTLSSAGCGKWRNRFLDALPRLNRAAQTTPAKLMQEILRSLDDRPRSGRPAAHSPQQVMELVLMTCRNPGEYGRELSRWTLSELTQAVLEHTSIKQISRCTVWRILSRADIKPWKSRYWLNSADKVENPDEFSAKVSEICALYQKAQEQQEEHHHIVCMDEMTGLQVLERKYADKLVRPGYPFMQEFEYIRHGTVCLTGAINVADGTVFDPFLKDTRTSQDFVTSVAKVVDTNPEDRWTFIVDGLNTHKSAALVHFVARRCDIGEDLGIVGREGILKNMESRAAFLSDASHRIRFVYTPRHCSWVNQIEIFFSSISRRLLARRNHKSKREMCASIRRYFWQHNLNAKPYNWTYTGQPKEA